MCSRAQNLSESNHLYKHDENEKRYKNMPKSKLVRNLYFYLCFAIALCMLPLEMAPSILEEEVMHSGDRFRFRLRDRGNRLQAKAT